MGKVKSVSEDEKVSCNNVGGTTRRGIPFRYVQVWNNLLVLVNVGCVRKSLSLQFAHRTSFISACLHLVMT